MAKGGQVISVLVPKGIGDPILQISILGTNN